LLPSLHLRTKAFESLTNLLVCWLLTADGKQGSLGDDVYLRFDSTGNTRN